NTPRVSCGQPAIAGEGPEREHSSVSVIPQIEDSRKADSRIPRLVPVSVTVLGIDQIRDAVGDGWMLDLTCCHQTKQSPSGLRCCAVRRLAVGFIGKIGLGAFAPAAVGVLAVEQPVDCSFHRRGGWVGTRGGGGGGAWAGSREVICGPPRRTAHRGFPLHPPKFD